MTNLRLARILVMLLLLLSLGADAFGQFCAPPSPPPPPFVPFQPEPCGGPGGGGGSGMKVGGLGGSCDLCKGSPCAVATGGYLAGVSDLEVTTPGFPLAASRSYESSRPIDGLLGVGWTSSLAARLYYATYLYQAPAGFHKEADIVMPTGKRYRFVESPDGTFTPPSSRHDSLVRNPDGTFDLSLADDSTRIHFGATGRIESIADAFGNTLSFAYDANDRLQRVSDLAGSGRYLDVYYGGDGRISTVQDHTGRTVEYVYDTNGTLIEVTDPANRATAYSYQTVRYAPLLTRITDPWGRIVTDVTYDTQGRTKTYVEDGETYTYTYNYLGRADQSSKTDSAGNRWIYTYAADGVVSERSFPGGGVQQAVYNADRSIQSETDEVGVVTAYTYGANARTQTVTLDAAGTSAVRFDYAYDPVFDTKVTSILPKVPSTGTNDPDWQGMQYEYYPTGSTAPGALWKVSRMRSDGTTADLVATHEYNSRGQLVKTTDAMGGVTDRAYDAAGNLETVTSPANNTSGVRPVFTYGYDALGRVTTVTDPLGKATTYAYDALDRVTSVTLPKPSAGSPLSFTQTYAYDAWDSAASLVGTTVTDPNGRTTTLKYDVFDRLAKSTDALGKTTSYGYTRALLTSITDANDNVTTYAYDAAGRLKETVFPDGAKESYTYFNDGLLKTKTDRRNQTTAYTYDAHKRLKRRTYPGGGYVESTYAGRKLTQVADTSVSPSETHTFAYDTAFRMSSQTQGSRGTISYTHQADDRVATATVSGGPVTTYAYYADGSLKTIDWSLISGQFSYAYRLNGQYDTIAFPNGQTRSHAYDDQGRLTSIANVHPLTGDLGTFSYAYDVDHATGAATMLGQRVTQTHGGVDTKYRYDGNGQLVRVDYPNVAPFNGEVHSWTYDAIGNRLDETVNGTTQSYTYQKIGANPKNWLRLTSDGTNSYTYDANGNTQTRTGFTFGWSYEDRLTSVTGGGGAVYQYDYAGRRTVAGTASYLYEGAQAVRETDTVSAEYLFGPGIDEPLALWKGGQAYYYVSDGLGSITALATPAGAVQNSYTYDAWGELRASSELTPQPYRYTGREGYGPGDLLFYRARSYEPSTSRFLSEDPLTSAGARATFGIAQDGFPTIPDATFDPTLAVERAAHTYAYVLNDPAQHTDPEGTGKAPIVCVYYIVKCADDATNCVNKLKCKMTQMSDDEIAQGDTTGPSATQYTQCFQSTKSCQKMMKKCGPKYAKGPPGFPPLGEMAMNAKKKKKKK